VAITNALKLAFALIIFSSVGFAQEIPFDSSVPETNAGSGQEQAPPPPQTPADNAVENNSKTPPPSTVMPSAAAPSKEAELNGATPPTDAENPPLPPVATPKATKGKTPAELAGLGKLAPFSDIAVITKRFLPKTHRFEFFPNFGLVMNDAFFTDLVIGGRLGFYLNENWGIEASAMSISTSPKNVTSELKNNFVVQTQSLSTPNSFFGADVKWDPIYGKVAFMNNSIVPFDFYFSGGGGVTGTSGGTSAPTIHLGAGQLFAITKWCAGRWDISWYGYSATSTVNNTSSFFTNLHATIGMSFFFPGAEYR
jgi:outer membrane beta-barrel protein